MSSETRQSFILSVVLHGGVALLGVVFILIQSLLKEPEPLVFELVSAAAPAVQAPVQPVESEPVDLQVERPEPLKPIPEIPEPAPEPEPPRESISYDDWKRNRELPERVQRIQQPRTPPPRDVPTIETQVRDRLTSRLSPIEVEGVDLEALNSLDALQAYLASLRSRIQAAFQPEGANLEAEAVFTVTASGRLQDIRLSRSSGVAAFDQGVLRTLRTTRTPGPPPGNRAYTFSLVFRGE
jgi:TonB family protein